MSVYKTFESIVNKTDSIDKLIELLESHRNKVTRAREIIKLNRKRIEALQEEIDRVEKEYYFEMGAHSIEYLIKDKIAFLAIMERKNETQKTI